jgi:hypothetical protein
MTDIKVGDDARIMVAPPAASVPRLTLEQRGRVKEISGDQALVSWQLSDDTGRQLVHTVWVPLANLAKVDEDQ